MGAEVMVVVGEAGRTVKLFWTRIHIVVTIIGS